MDIDALVIELRGKTIVDVTFHMGMSRTCLFIRSIEFTDGSTLEFSVKTRSDWCDKQIDSRIGYDNIMDVMRVWGDYSDNRDEVPQ